MKEIRVGLLGCGYMGGMHLACYSAMENVRVAAVADVREAYLKSAAGRTGAPAFSDAAKLIEEADVDVIDVCLPTFLHARHAVAAMKKGRHVFIEKPLCLTEREADELLDMQKKTGVSVQVGQVIRFWDEYEYLRGAVGDGRFGAVKGAHFLRRSPSPDWGWENWLHDPARSGGAGFDLHIHDSDYMLSLFGQPASSVSAVNVRGEKNGYVTTLAFYDGFSVTAEGGWDLPANYPFEMAYSAVFERAAVEFSSRRGLTVYPEDGEPYSPEIRRQSAVSESEQGGNISSLGGYYNELEYFISCIAEGRQPEKATLADAAASVRFVLKELQ